MNYLNYSYLSASGGDRALKCPPAFALPRAERIGDDSDARNGTEIHSFCERMQTMPRAEALALCPDEVRDTCAAIDTTDIPHGHAELAFVYDVATDTAVCLGKIPHREYAKALGRPLKDSEIPCTIDLVIHTEPDHWEASDWKSGYESVPDPETSMQMGIAAVCLARVYGGTTEVSVRRIGSDGQIHVATAELDTFAIEDCADRWRTAWALVTAARNELANGGTLATNPGDWCKFCDAKANCPSFAGIARELLAPGSDWLSRAKTLIDDDAVAADLWLKVQRGRELLATMQGLLEARAVERPFALPDGMIVRQVETSRDSVANPKIVLEVLTDLYGAEVASAVVATKLHTTKGAIEKAAAAQAPKGQGAKETRRVLTVLRERNAIVTSTGVSVEAVEPKRLGKAS